MLAHRTSKVRQSLFTLEPRILDDPSIGIARKVGGPLYESRTFMWTRGNCVAAYGGDDAGVAECGCGGNDGVGNEMINRLDTPEVSA